MEGYWCGRLAGSCGGGRQSVLEPGALACHSDFAAAAPQQRVQPCRLASSSGAADVPGASVCGAGSDAHDTGAAPTAVPPPAAVASPRRPGSWPGKAGGASRQRDGCCPPGGVLRPARCVCRPLLVPLPFQPRRCTGCAGWLACGSLGCCSGRPATAGGTLRCACRLSAFSHTLCVPCRSQVEPAVRPVPGGSLPCALGPQVG